MDNQELTRLVAHRLRMKGRSDLSNELLGISGGADVLLGQAEKAQLDAELCGIGITVDGRRIDPLTVQIFYPS
jgi:hypothetical protein